MGGGPTNKYHALPSSRMNVFRNLLKAKHIATHTKRIESYKTRTCIRCANGVDFNENPVSEKRSKRTATNGEVYTSLP